jgi:co-chaperonin GroES (HSP10)
VEEQRIVSLEEQDPLTLIPHGDRLLLEVLWVDETRASGIEIVRSDDAAKETEMGWFAGLIINKGSGHRLDSPDQAILIKTTEKVTNEAARLVMVDDETGEGVWMAPSSVPMPFDRGMVVMGAKYAGSKIFLRGKEYRIITQSHVIGVFTGVKMRVGEPALPAFNGETLEAAAYSGDE